MENRRTCFRQWPNWAGAGDNPEDYEFMKKMRKYALVSDNPSILLRIAVLFGGNGPIKMKIFPMHERDRARQWIEQDAV